ncbi:MAG: HAMP domain-containing sensor histidine kinase [Bacteroidetes bacterium]|nr:HAMP domain-containing sensor histidine kinase [Bacteroidota bacterium]
MANLDQKRRTGSVFWKVALVLITAQLTIGILAVGFTAWFARDQQKSLASEAMTARLDAVSEEIERRSAASDVAVDHLSDDLKLDLGYRFPDPLFILNLDGSIVETILPASDAFPAAFIDTTVVSTLPDIIDLENTFTEIFIDVSDEKVPGGYASAPLLDSGGFPVGFLVIQPVRQSIALELADSNAAFRKSIRLIAGFSIIVALLLGAFFTWWLVRPLRLIAGAVSHIGEGRYDVRLSVKGNDEFASLSQAINQMTEKVQSSIDSLKESDRIRRELVANVGHDLRTPLAAIEANLEEAERFRSEGRPLDYDHAVKQARRQSRVLAGLISDLFELSRLESAVPRLNLEPVPVGELISDAISSVAATSKDSGIVVKSVVDPQIPIVLADGVLLLRLLTNLLSNAVRYAEADSEVVISAHFEQGRTRISVLNRGKAIPPEELERVFDRYYRGSHARTRAVGDNREGTGLGLAISKAIAEAHGGSLTVTSQSDSGTVFTFELPVVAQGQDVSPD